MDSRVALVTGCGGQRGIGRAVALKLASAGIEVAVTDIGGSSAKRPAGGEPAGWRGLVDVAGEISDLGRDCFARECDLCDAAGIQTLVDDVLEHYGHVDILVNNARATIGQDHRLVTEMDEAVWNEFLSINVTAPFLLTKLIGASMIEMGRGGRIVNVGSTASKQAGMFESAYAASKFALHGLTQASALDLAQFGITVNAVCPGPVDSGRPNHWEEARARQLGVDPQDFRGQLNAQKADAIPLGRLAKSDEVAHLICFLVSPEASYITGQGYNVNGGALLS